MLLKAAVNGTRPPSEHPAIRITPSLQGHQEPGDAMKRLKDIEAILRDIDGPRLWHGFETTCIARNKDLSAMQAKVGLDF